MRIGIGMAALALLVAGGASAAPEKAVPYWASIGAGKANLRTGPGRNYPTSWIYQRPGMPVKVIEVYPSWRKVQDPDGTTGWMIVNLLSDQRTGMVTGGTHEMRASPAADAALLWKVEPGVVGKISHCANGWCQFEVQGRTGYIEMAGLWGVFPGETVK